MIELVDMIDMLKPPSLPSKSPVGHIMSTPLAPRLPCRQRPDCCNLDAPERDGNINCWLVVDLPLWKNISQLGELFPICGKIKMFQTTNQDLFRASNLSPINKQQSLPGSNSPKSHHWSGGQTWIAIAWGCNLYIWIGGSIWIRSSRAHIFFYIESINWVTRSTSIWSKHLPGSNDPGR